MKQTIFLLLTFVFTLSSEAQFTQKLQPGSAEESSVSQNAPGEADYSKENNAVSQNAPENAAPAVLKGDALRRNVVATLKKWAKAKSEPDCHQAALDFVDLVLALAQDDEMPLNTKKELSVKVKYRLKSLSTRISAYNEIHRKERKKAEKGAEAATVQLPGNSVVLAQQGNNFAEVMGDNAKTSNYEQEGEKLVELIQKTIRTQTWEVNGGFGQIEYYGQQKVLVISQTQEAHEEIAALLEQLRRAGN